VAGIRKIVWDKEAIKQLNEVFEYLKEKSLPAAKKVILSIQKAIQELPKHPEVYGLDRFKVKNDGSIRAFEKYNYRITYQITKTQIVIVRVRHTSREPLKH
jgi:plasmid stabilization system protein ParE